MSNDQSQIAPPVGPYTPARRSGDWVFCSGQIGLSNGEIVEGGVSAETMQALDNLKALLASEGIDPTCVVKTTCFLTDIADYDAFNDAYVCYFPSPRPARSCVAVKALPKGACVEIEAIAYLGN